MVRDHESASPNRRPMSTEPEPPDAGVRHGIERVVGGREAHCRKMVCSVRRERDIRGAGVKPDELGTTADLHPVGPVPAGPARDRGGNLIIEVEQLVSPRSVAYAHVESPRAGGNGRPCHPRADHGHTTELQRPRRQRTATEQVDASERRACAQAILVGDRQRDVRQEP